MYKPKLSFNVPAIILTATYEKINGVNVKTFTESEKTMAFIFAGDYKCRKDSRI